MIQKKSGKINTKPSIPFQGNFVPLSSHCPISLSICCPKTVRLNSKRKPVVIWTGRNYRRYCPDSYTIMHIFGGNVEKQQVRLLKTTVYLNFVPFTPNPLKVCIFPLHVALWRQTIVNLCVPQQLVLRIRCRSVILKMFFKRLDLNSYCFFANSLSVCFSKVTSENIGCLATICLPIRRTENVRPSLSAQICARITRL